MAPSNLDSFLGALEAELQALEPTVDNLERHLSTLECELAALQGLELDLQPAYVGRLLTAALRHDLDAWGTAQGRSVGVRVARIYARHLSYIRSQLDGTQALSA